MVPAAVLVRRFLSLSAGPDSGRAVRFAVDAVVAMEQNVCNIILIGVCGTRRSDGLPTGDSVDETIFGGPPEPPGVAWVMNPAEDMADPDAFRVRT